MLRPGLLILSIVILSTACTGKRTQVRLRAPVEITADRVRVEAACSIERRVSECTGGRWCKTRMVATPIPCPDDEIEVTTAWGDEPSAPLPVSGTVAIRIEPPAGHTVKRDDVSITRKRTYRSAMLFTDLGVLLGGGLLAIAVPQATGSSESMIAGIMIAGISYHAAAPIVHARYGNRRASGRSLARRVLTTVGAGVALLYLGGGCGDDGGECHADEAAIAALAWVVAVPVNILVDFATAKLEVELPLDTVPTISTSREGAVVGLGGRF